MHFLFLSIGESSSPNFSSTLRPRKLRSNFGFIGGFPRHYIVLHIFNLASFPKNTATCEVYVYRSSREYEHTQTTSHNKHLRGLTKMSKVVSNQFHADMNIFIA